MRGLVRALPVALLPAALLGCVTAMARHPLPAETQSMDYGQARRTVIASIKGARLQEHQFPFIQLDTKFNFEVQPNGLVFSYNRFQGLLDDKGVPMRTACDFEYIDDIAVVQYGNKQYPWGVPLGAQCDKLALYFWTQEQAFVFARALAAMKRYSSERLDVNPSASPSGLSRDDLTNIVLAAVAAKAAAPESPAAPPPSDVAAPNYQEEPRLDDFAVVVGIEKYSDIPPAQFAQRDAEAVKDHLLALGFPARNVVYLSGEKAGYKSIEKFIETWLPRNVQENSRVFFYFSGHGAPDVQSGRAYLLPWDGDPNFLENTGYPLERLYAKLAALRAQQVVVALDACFSGAGGRSMLAKGARPLVVGVELGKAPSDKLILLSAAAGKEITSTIEQKGHGIFTYFLLKGLNGGAKDAGGRVTVKSLYDYLKPLAQDEARRQNREQTPMLEAAADFVLRTR